MRQDINFIRSDQILEGTGRIEEEVGRKKKRPLELRHPHLHLAGGNRRAAIAGVGDQRLHVSTCCAAGPALVENGGPEVIWAVDLWGLRWGPPDFRGIGWVAFVGGFQGIIHLIYFLITP